MLTEEETLIATLATQIYSNRIYHGNSSIRKIKTAVELAKEIIEASKETKPKTGLTPINRKKLVRKVREF